MILTIFAEFVTTNPIFLLVTTDVKDSS